MWGRICQHDYGGALQKTVGLTREFNHPAMILTPRSPGQPTPGPLVFELHQLPPIARVLARLQRLLSDSVSSLAGVADLIRLAFVRDYRPRPRRIIAMAMAASRSAMIFEIARSPVRPMSRPRLSL
jgi:hypothetical protein